MSTGSGMIAAIVIIVAILVVAIVYLKNKNNSINVNHKPVGDVLSLRSKSDYRINYTDRDKDLMELIHELSLIYDNTDKYLNH